MGAGRREGWMLRVGRGVEVAWMAVAALERRGAEPAGRAGLGWLLLGWATRDEARGCPGSGLSLAGTGLGALLAGRAAFP